MEEKTIRQLNDEAIDAIESGKITGAEAIEITRRDSEVVAEIAEDTQKKMDIINEKAEKIKSEHGETLENARQEEIVDNFTDSTREVGQSIIVKAGDTCKGNQEAIESIKSGDIKQAIKTLKQIKHQAWFEARKADFDKIFSHASKALDEIGKQAKEIEQTLSTGVKIEKAVIQEKFERSVGDTIREFKRSHYQANINQLNSEKSYLAIYKEQRDKEINKIKELAAAKVNKRIEKGQKSFFHTKKNRAIKSLPETCRKQMMEKALSHGSYARAIKKINKDWEPVIDKAEKHISKIETKCQKSYEAIKELEAHSSTPDRDRCEIITDVKEQIKSQARTVSQKSPQKTIKRDFDDIEH